MRDLKLSSALATAALLLASAALAAQGEAPDSFEAAKSLAADKDLPILVEFGTEW
jgi:hypothetical protein